MSFHRLARRGLLALGAVSSLLGAGAAHADEEEVSSRTPPHDWALALEVGGQVPSRELRTLADGAVRFTSDLSLARRLPLPRTYVELGGGFSTGALRNGLATGDPHCPGGPPCWAHEGSRQSLRGAHARLGLAAAIPLRWQLQLELGGGGLLTTLTAEDVDAGGVAGQRRYGWRTGLGGYGRAFLGYRLHGKGSAVTSGALGVATTLTLVATEGESFDHRVGQEGVAAGGSLTFSLRYYF